MRKRDVVILAVTHQRPPYVPWDVAYTPAAWRRLGEHVGERDLEGYAGNHFVYINSTVGAFEDAPDGWLRDGFGVTWRRGGDGEVGMIEGQVLPEPTLSGFAFPDARDPRHYAHIPELIDRHRDRFRMFAIGFTLLERAWTLRGMEPFMIDLLERPEFAEQLLDAITELNLAQIEMALRHDFDCVHFGDDWGQQRGLLIGRSHWRRFIFPRMKRMCAAVRRAGTFISIHSCGRIDELFDDLAELGVNIVNPLQPECMDVFGLMRSYAGRLAFHGGLSTQQTLPYGSPERVRRQTRRLVEAGAAG
ncbi:MAG: uroporphyrinogen decarboxylase family protein, partial [Planctomycetota bacterium]